jgi:hypothetical protein
MITARTVATALMTFCTPAALAESVPFWGARTPVAAVTAPEKLRPGEFTWAGEAVSAGPVVLVVSVSDQRAYVYRNGVSIGVSTVSTGRHGFETPTGVFTILQKDKDHHSSIYNNAAMPYTERLTWNGIALHAGGLPGFPSSHGCIHLPSEFARRLFEASTVGMTVVIADDASAPREVAHPPLLAPVDARTGAPMARIPLRDTDEFRWDPGMAADGPLTLLISTADLRVLVFRGGIEIGRSRLAIRGGPHLGTHAFVLMDGAGRGNDPFLPDRPALRWIAIGIAGHMNDAGAEVDPAAVERLVIPQQFVQRVYPLLQPGTTVMVTDAAVLPTTTGARLDVINADPPPRK